MTTTNKIEFKPAVRENVGLWINLIGGTGSGKTFSAMKLASGIAGDKPFALIDTENRRGLHYADMFNFDHAELSAPFRPEAYAEAVLAADAAGYPVIVIDSGSHVWAGEGGLLDWQEDELTRMAGDDWQKRERVKMSAWIKPKMAHKKMVQKLLQVKAHIILCLRAEEKIEMIKKDGKTVIQPKQSLTGLDGWIPICDKNLPFEATVSFLLIADRPGMPHPIKLQEQHKVIFPLDKPITEESGKLLAQWASGGTAKKVEDTATRVASARTHFNEMGVSDERILAAVGKSDFDQIGSVELATLQTLASDIKSENKTVTEAFPEIVTDRADIPTEPADTDDAAEATAAEAEADEPTTTSPESQLANLIESAKERVREITGGKTRETTELLNGRVLASMDLKQIQAFHKELDKLESK